MARLAFIDDHAMLADLARGALAADGHDVVYLPPAEVDELVDEVGAVGAVLVVVDLSLGADAPRGADVIAALCAHGHRCLALTGETDPIVLARCLEAGALGVVAKSSGFDSLVVSLVAALDGGDVEPSPTVRARWAQLLDAHRQAQRRQWVDFDRLTAREGIILGHLIEGRTAEEIARAEVSALATVRSHIKSILAKLGVRSQLAAVARARDAGWTPSGERSAA